METEVLRVIAAVVAAAVVAGGYALTRWIIAPVVDAQRLLSETDPPQELVYEDPNDPNEATKFHTFDSIAKRDASLSLSVIVPAYNEQDRILVMLQDTMAYLDKRKTQDPSFSYEVIVVDDCSQDKTVDIVMQEIKRYSIDRLKLLRLQKNHGKGGAIRKGVLRASGARILFADADGATKIQELEKLETAMTAQVASGKQGIVVCGSRAHLEEEAIATRSPLRNFLMHGFHLIVSTLCVRDVRDTQCGFKLFDRTAACLLFTPMHIERWAFDVELLYVASIRKFAVKEVAVEWHEVPGSKLSVIAASLTMLREIVLIRLCYVLGIWSIQDGGARLRRPTTN